MKALDFVEAMGLLDDRIILEVVKPMKNSKIRRKSLTSILIAAALIFALSITAYAVNSFNQKRRQEIKEQLSVEQNNVAGYVEYEQEQENGVTLLSAINNGSFQDVYVNISPVSEDDARAAVGGDKFRWSIDGGSSGGFASVTFDVNKLTQADLVTVHNEELGTTFQTYDIERVRDVAMEDSYDVESKTLTLKLSIPSDWLEGKSEVELSIYNVDENYEVTACLGKAKFSPTGLEMREIRFDNAVTFENETIDESGRILGMRLSATGMSWLIEIPGAESFADGNADTKEKQELLMSWFTAVDKTLSDSKLIFADGTKKTVYAGESLPYEAGLVLGEVNWYGSVDVNGCTAVEIMGQIIEIR